ncbi:MAG: trehalose 6-phosphate synthase [Thermodesulfobacteriota bacterium]
MKTLEEFIQRMRDTLPVRRQAVSDILTSGRFTGSVNPLGKTLSEIEDLPRENGRYRLEVSGLGERALDFSYETTELHRDIRFLTEGEEALAEELAAAHSGFEDRVREGIEFLSGNRFRNLFSDRDGTVNNYCARYNTSVQSAYNAVFITRYVKTQVRNAVVLTSAPLADVGIVDMSAMPEGAVILGGSKGREMKDTQGGRHRYEIPEDQAEKLSALNDRLKALLEQPEYRKFSLIGSGLQFKFGQTTVARQDINESVDPKESEKFLDTIRDLVVDLDPESRDFRIEDTGKDIEIMLTVKTEEKDDRRDFDKGDGIRFIDHTLNLGMAEGPNLICGDTGSDVPMVAAALDRCPDTRAIFVTGDEDLKQRVRAVGAACFFVETPDMLVMILNRLGQRGNP